MSPTDEQTNNRPFEDLYGRFILRTKWTVCMEWSSSRKIGFRFAPRIELCCNHFVTLEHHYRGDVSRRPCWMSVMATGGGATWRIIGPPDLKSVTHLNLVLNAWRLTPAENW